jgi:hypothetical protein
MPAIIRGHVNFVAKDADGDALLKPGEMLTSEAARLGDCSLQAVRQWIKKHRIGRWEPRLQMFIVDGQKLEAHYDASASALLEQTVFAVVLRAMVLDRYRRLPPLSTLTSRAPSRAPCAAPQ